MLKHYSPPVLMIGSPSKAWKAVMCFEEDDDGEDIHSLLVKIRQECFSYKYFISFRQAIFRKF